MARLYPEVIASPYSSEGEAMVYTHGTWIARPGQEEEFVRRWLELGEWTTENFAAARGSLARDLGEANRFVSFGPWPSVEHAERWRDSDGYRERVDRILEVVEAFEPRLLQLVAEVS
jgi:heme-degrading monooxygenase HmoA